MKPDRRLRIVDPVEDPQRQETRACPTVDKAVGGNSPHSVLLSSVAQASKCTVIEPTRTGVAKSRCPAATRWVPVALISVLAATWIGAADNSWYREKVDAFTDETEFVLTIASSGLVESEGQEGAMLGLACSPNARWIPPIERPDGRLLGDDRLEGFQVWFAFVGDTGGDTGEWGRIRRSDLMAEVRGGDGYDIFFELRVDQEELVWGMWEWTGGADGSSTVFVPDSTKVRVARMVVGPLADGRAPARLMAQMLSSAVHHVSVRNCVCEPPLAERDPIRRLLPL